MSRIRSDFWVSAHLRRCALEGVDAVLRRRGAAEAGAIFVGVDLLDGRSHLYGPAPQSEIVDAGTGRLFVPIILAGTGAAISERMAREIRFDPDLWWISIDDRAGRSLLDLVAPPVPPRSP